MSSNADALEDMGRRSGNPIFEDFAVLAAQYRRAYAKALPTYTKIDSLLGRSASFLVKSIVFACKSSA
jgi:hypothetical protein